MMGAFDGVRKHVLAFEWHQKEVMQVKHHLSLQVVGYNHHITTPRSIPGTHTNSSPSYAS